MLRIFLLKNFTTSFFSMLNISASVYKLKELYCLAVLSIKMLKDAF